MIRKTALSLVILVGLGSLFLLVKFYWEGIEEQPSSRLPIESETMKGRVAPSSSTGKTFMVIESLPKPETEPQPPKLSKDSEPGPTLTPPEPKDAPSKSSPPKTELKTEPIKPSMEAKSNDSEPISKIKKKPKSKGSTKISRPSPPDLKGNPTAPQKVDELVVFVKPGDNIYSIAAKFYHIANTSIVDMILELNPKITQPNILLVNQKVQLPVISPESMIIEASDGTCLIRLGTFLKPEYADYLKGNPVIQGKEVEITSWKIPDGQVWHRAMAGKFDSREEGLKVILELKEKGLSPYFPTFKYKE